MCPFCKISWEISLAKDRGSSAISVLRWFSIQQYYPKKQLDATIWTRVSCIHTHICSMLSNFSSCLFVHNKLLQQSQCHLLLSWLIEQQPFFSSFYVVAAYKHVPRSICLYIACTNTPYTCRPWCTLNEHNDIVITGSFGWATQLLNVQLTWFSTSYHMSYICFHSGFCRICFISILFLQLNPLSSDCVNMAHVLHF